MLPLPTTEPVLISTSSQFEHMVQHLSDEPRLAVDTESNSLFAYRERVCLVQISTPTIDYLIDPFLVKDLSLLSRIFSNPDQLKIFHAAEYDFICLKRDYSFDFIHIFDTMVAARILGETAVGLGSLLDKYFGITLDKRYQRANWGTRPFSKVMLNYARMDTHFLFALQEQFEEQLREHHLLELAREDFSILCGTEPPEVDPSGKSCWKVAGAAHIDGWQAAILQALCAYRDQQARSMDLPHFKVLSNELLLQLSQVPPHSPEELRLVPGVTERMFNRHGTGLLNAIAQGEAAKPVVRPLRKRSDKKFSDRLEKLKDWRKKQAKELKLESDIILPKDIMEKIAMNNPENKKALQAVMHQTPWRYKQYGAAILKELSASEEHENHV